LIHTLDHYTLHHVFNIWEPPKSRA
jgi:hypothetical protein